MINKEAQRPRGHSTDPKQEKLREDKAKFNEQCSDFIARINDFKPRLIALKRGLNGRGDPKAGIPASSIKDPLPSEVPAHLSEIAQEFQGLTSTFQQLVSEVGGIVQEQQSYSQNRRKPAHADWNRADELIAEGSNKVTRFFSGITNIFSFNPTKPQRISMLKAAEELYYFIIEVEEKLLDKGTENIKEIRANMVAITTKLEGLEIKYNTLADKNKELLSATNNTAKIDKVEESEEAQQQTGKDDAAKSIKETDQKVNEVEKAQDQAEKEVVEEAKKSPLEALMPPKQDIPAPPPPAEPEPKLIDATSLGAIRQNVINIGKSKLVNIELVKEFTDLFNRYVEAKKNKRLAQASAMKPGLDGLYQEIYEEFFKAVQEIQGHKLMEQTPVANLLKMIKANQEHEMYKEAGKITNVVKKLIRRWGPKDKTTGERLAAYENLFKMRKKVNEIMDILEETTVETSEENIEADMKDDTKLVGKLVAARQFLVEAVKHTDNLYNDYFGDALIQEKDDSFNRRLNNRYQRQMIADEVAGRRNRR